MATGTLAPVGRQQYLDNDGDPVASGKVYTYLSGTTTPLATYTNHTLTVAHPNPVVLDSAGRASIYLGPYSYKFVLKDADDVTIWTADPVQAVAPHSVDLDIGGTAGEALAAGDSVYLSGGDGGTTPGRWYKTDASDTNKSSAAPMIGMVPAPISQGAAGTIRLQGKMEGLAGLNAGGVYYCSETAGAITTSAPTNQRLVGVADSATSLVLFSSAVGNIILTSGIGFTPLESVGGQGAIVATINASPEGLKIVGSLIEIDGTVTFSTGYDPTGKIATGGAAADVNAGATTISGAKITTGSVTTTQLSFVPVQSTDVIAKINASVEGIDITADRIAISGLTTFAAGYDPTGKIATGGAAADVNAGVTTIDGDKITTGSITATQIEAGTITANEMTIATLSAISADLGTVTAGSVSGVTITAGGGVVTIDADGVWIEAGAILGGTDLNAYNFVADHGSADLRYYELDDSGTTRRTMLLQGVALDGSIDIYMEATGPTGNAYFGVLGHESQGGIAYIYSSTRTEVNGPLFRPGADNTTYLGAAGYRWNQPYFNLPSASTGYVNVVVKADGSLWYPTSTAASKRDLEPVTLDDADRLLALVPPVLYRGVEDPDDARKLPGVLAEDLEQAGLPELVAYRDGAPVSVYYDRLPVYLLALLRDTRARLAALEASA